MLVSKKEIQNKLDLIPQGIHPIYISARGEEAIYAHSQKSNPTYPTCYSPCVMQTLYIEPPNGI